MKAPIVPMSTPEDWTVIHDDGQRLGCGSSLAFTSRRAIETVEGDLLIQDREWGWGIRVDSLRAQMLSFVPNRSVLVLDEAWEWKFPTECPSLRSAEDGLLVLKNLLEGRTTLAQNVLYPNQWLVSDFALYDHPGGRLCHLAYLRDRWKLYCRADEWLPNNASNGEGSLVVKPAEERCWVLASPDGFPLTWNCDFLSSSLPPNREVMVLGASGDNSIPAWLPQGVTRTIPCYLTAL